MVGARPLSSIGKFPKGNLKATAYNDIVVDFVLPTLWQQFGEGPFLFQNDNPRVHMAKSTQKWFVEIVVEDLNIID
jgi:hypothetical protein